MKSLRITMSISVEEFEPGEHDCHSTGIARATTSRIVEGAVRTKARSLEPILEREVELGAEDAVHALLSRLRKVPLRKTVRDQVREHEAALGAMFPGYRLGVYLDCGKFVVCDVSRPGDDSDYRGEPVPHPLDPDGPPLTTKYSDSFRKLEDGTWTYMYQCSDFYREVLERVDPPVDEYKIAKYFADLGLEHEVATHPFRELPEVQKEDSE